MNEIDRDITPTDGLASTPAPEATVVKKTQGYTFYSDGTVKSMFKPPGASARSVGG
jgi:hypothetical protein